MALWLALRFPQLMIDALPDSSARDLPLAVREQQRLVTVNARAAAAGIRCGMRAASALALCDNLHIRDRQAGAEQRWLAQQARVLASFTPMIYRDDNCLLLEIGSSLRLFHGLDPLLAQLLPQLPATTSCHAGLGLTPIAAQVLSHAGLAASRACIVLHQHQLDLPASRQRLLALLATQPLATLPFSAGVKRALQGPGLRTLGELLALPGGALQRRFGTEFRDWLARLRGDQPDLRQPLITPARFSSTLEFAQPLTTSAQLQPPMQQLLERMQHWLIQHQQQVRAIRWLFFPHCGDAERLLVRRAGGDHRATVWFDLTRRHLEHTRLPHPVLTLRLEAARSLPMAAPPAHLFAALERPGSAELLARLDNLPGLTLYRPAGGDSHLPEESEHNADPLAITATPVAAPAPLADTPLWLLEKPLALRCRDQLPCWRGCTLELLPGTQQCNEPWWQQARQRHYRVARHPLGLFCWLFHYREQPQQWFLHGFF